MWSHAFPFLLPLPIPGGGPAATLGLGRSGWAQALVAGVVGAAPALPLDMVDLESDLRVVETQGAIVDDNDRLVRKRDENGRFQPPMRKVVYSPGNVTAMDISHMQAMMHRATHPNFWPFLLITRSK